MPRLFWFAMGLGASDAFNIIASARPLAAATKMGGLHAALSMEVAEDDASPVVDTSDDAEESDTADESEPKKRLRGWRRGRDGNESGAVVANSEPNESGRPTSEDSSPILGFAAAIGAALVILSGDGVSVSPGATNPAQARPAARNNRAPAARAGPRAGAAKAKNGRAAQLAAGGRKLDVQRRGDVQRRELAKRAGKNGDTDASRKAVKRRQVRSPARAYPPFLPGPGDPRPT